MLSKRFLLALIPLAGSFTLTGCQPEEKIAHVTRPRLNDMKRFLAAIVLPEKDAKEQNTWVFKVVGSESEMDPLVETFNQFLRSIKKLPTPENPQWPDLPPGWKVEKGKGKGMRYATILTGPKGKAPELTVTVLPGEQSVPNNVNRWRTQIGLKVLDTRDALNLELFYREETVGGQEAFVVDMIGPKMPPPMVEAELPGPSFKYATPPGWKEFPPVNNLFVLNFLIQEMDKKAMVTVSEFKEDGGGLLENVNRWRVQQLGLDPLTAAQANALPDIPIGNATGKLADITGDAKVAPERNRILGAILFRENKALFFKMTGPSDLIGQQRPAFATFLKSVNFGAEE